MLTLPELFSGERFPAGLPPVPPCSTLRATNRPSRQPPCLKCCPNSRASSSMDPEAVEDSEESPLSRDIGTPSDWRAGTRNPYLPHLGAPRVQRPYRLARDVTGN